MTYLTASTFDAEVLNKPSFLVLFGAEWHVPCNRIRVALAKLVTNAGYVDIDKHPSLAMRFSIRNIPLVALFQDGVITDQGSTITPGMIAAVGG